MEKKETKQNKKSREKCKAKSKIQEATLTGQQWHYFAVKKLLALLVGVTFKHYGDFYCLNCLHIFRTKNKLESHKKVCKNKDF